MLPTILAEECRSAASDNVKQERNKQMKQLNIVIATMLVAVFAMALQAQTNDVAAAVDQIATPQSINVVENCANTEINLPTDVDEVRALLEAAENCDAKAQFDLGKRYEYGNGVAKNYVEAVKWYRTSAEQGYANAQQKLGECYWRCWSNPNPKEAEKWMCRAVESYRKAAEKGDAEAQFQLGKCYAYGNGAVEDAAEAAKWIRKAAEQGNVDAQYFLGQCYGRSLPYTNFSVWLPRPRIVQGNAKEAAKFLLMAAKCGHIDAQYAIGYCYRHGEGVDKNDDEAAKWFSKATEHGSMAAQFELAKCYATGEGVSQDKTMSAKLFRKVAERGDASAQIKLGDCYRYGEGVENNGAEAVKWYREAAVSERKGRRIGICFGGIGIGKDNEIASSVAITFEETELHEEEMLNDLDTHDVAVLRLADCYEQGIGVEKDAAEAIRLLKEAANPNRRSERCNCDFSEHLFSSPNTKVAMLRLAGIYSNGDEKSFVEATKWRIKAWWIDHPIGIWWRKQGDTVISIAVGIAFIAYMIFIAGWAVREIKDRLRFIRLRRKAYAGDVDAMLKVARHYDYCFSPWKRKKAVEWYRKAAELGNAEAVTKLGESYSNREGVVKDK